MEGSSKWRQFGRSGVASTLQYAPQVLPPFSYWKSGVNKTMTLSELYRRPVLPNEKKPISRPTETASTNRLSTVVPPSKPDVNSNQSWADDISKEEEGDLWRKRTSGIDPLQGKLSWADEVEEWEEKKMEQQMEELQSNSSDQSTSTIQPFIKIPIQAVPGILQISPHTPAHRETKETAQSSSWRRGQTIRSNPLPSVNNFSRSTISQRLSYSSATWRLGWFNPSITDSGITTIDQISSSGQFTWKHHARDVDFKRSIEHTCQIFADKKRFNCAVCLPPADILSKVLPKLDQDELSRYLCGPPTFSESFSNFMRYQTSARDDLFIEKVIPDDTSATGWSVKHYTGRMGQISRAARAMMWLGEEGEDPARRTLAIRFWRNADRSNIRQGSMSSPSGVTPDKARSQSGRVTAPDIDPLAPLALPSKGSMRVPEISYASKAAQPAAFDYISTEFPGLPSSSKQ